MAEVRSLVFSLGTTPVSPKPLKKHKEAERRQALFDNHRTSGCGSAPARSSSPSGVPPQLSPWECLIPRCDAGQASWDRPPSRGGFPVGVRTQFQRCTSHTGHSAGRLMPEPLGSGLQIRPRAPHSPHRPACLPNGVLTGRDGSGLVTFSVTNVNKYVTNVFPLSRSPDAAQRNPGSAFPLAASVTICESQPGLRCAASGLRAADATPNTFLANCG